MNIGQKALADAGIKFDKVEQAFVGYVYGKLRNKWFNICLHRFLIK